MIYPLAFALGAATAAVWVLYIRSVAAQRAKTAALADFAIMVIGTLTLQLWALEGDNLWVPLSMDVGAALGTYALVRLGVR